MLMYVVVQFVEEFESEATKPDAQDMVVGGKVCCVLVLLTSGYRYMYLSIIYTCTCVQKIKNGQSKSV